MPIDKVSTDANLTVTSGALVITSRVYANPAVLAAFSAINNTPATATVALGPGNVYATVTVTITPNTAVGIVAEGKRFVEDHAAPSRGTLL